MLHKFCQTSQQKRTSLPHTQPQIDVLYKALLITTSYLELRHERLDLSTLISTSVVQ